ASAAMLAWLAIGAGPGVGRPLGDPSQCFSHSHYRGYRQVNQFNNERFHRSFLLTQSGSTRKNRTHDQERGETGPHPSGGSLRLSIFAIPEINHDEFRAPRSKAPNPNATSTSPFWSPSPARKIPCIEESNWRSTVFMTGSKESETSCLACCLSLWANRLAACLIPSKETAHEELIIALAKSRMNFPFGPGIAHIPALDGRLDRCKFAQPALCRARAQRRPNVGAAGHSQPRQGFRGILWRPRFLARRILVIAERCLGKPNSAGKELKERSSGPEILHHRAIEVLSVDFTITQVRRTGYEIFALDVFNQRVIRIKTRRRPLQRLTP